MFKVSQQPSESVLGLLFYYFYRSFSAWAISERVLCSQETSASALQTLSDSGLTPLPPLARGEGVVGLCVLEPLWTSHVPPDNLPWRE